MSKQWVQCALPGCEIIFHPTADDHRFCCLDHAREYDGAVKRSMSPSLSQKRQELLNAVMRDFDRIFGYVPRTGKYSRDDDDETLGI